MLDFEAMFQNPVKAGIKVNVKATAKKPKKRVTAKTTVRRTITVKTPARAVAQAVRTIAKLPLPAAQKRKFANKLQSKMKVIRAKTAKATKLVNLRPAAKVATASFAKRALASARLPQVRLRTQLSGAAGLKRPLAVRGSAKPASARFGARMGLRGRLRTGRARLATLTPAAPKLASKVRAKAAANILAGAAKKVARKGIRFPRRRKGEAKAKACAVIRPIAAACKCATQPVLTQVEAELGKCGYPMGAAKTLLAGLHDMNVQLEKAALQRLATHEHNNLSSKKTFEAQVLRKLSKIAKTLPSCHPIRTRAHLTVLKRAANA